MVVKFTKIVNFGQDWSLKIVLNFNTVAPHQQIPLIYVVNEDDELLANSPDAEWYKILQNLPWEQYRSIAADYYNALYHFNKSKTHSHKSSDLSEEQKETARKTGSSLSCLLSIVLWAGWNQADGKKPN